MPKIPNMSVIVSYDVSKDEDREKLHKFLVNELNAKKKTESTYEFVFDKKVKFEWKEIKQKISDIIKSNDTVYLWDMRYNEDNNKYELFRTEI